MAQLSTRVFDPMSYFRGCEPLSFGWAAVQFPLKRADRRRWWLKANLHPASQAVYGNAQPLVQGRIGFAQVVSVGQPPDQDIRFTPPGAEVGRHRDDLEARFAKSARRPGHMHCRCNQKDPVDAVGRQP